MMLRPLQVFEHDKQGNLVVGEDGKRVPLSGKKAGEPIPLDELPDAFHEYWRSREEDLSVARYQARVARETILRAAQADVTK